MGNLLGPDWLRSPLIGVSGSTFTNTGIVAAEVYQTLPIPAGYRYTFSLWNNAASDPAARITINRRGSESQQQDVLPLISSPVVSSGTLSDAGTGFTVAVLLQPGQAIDLSQAQLEAQPSASPYRPAMGSLSECPLGDRRISIRCRRTKLIQYKDQDRNTRLRSTMSTINIVKEMAEADSPLLLFQCRLADGSYQCFSTQNIWFNGQNYSSRVLKHDLFDFQLSSDDAMDSIATLSLTLANADSFLSEIGASIGWKGTQLTVYFSFVDLVSGITTTESTILFRGVAGDPDQIDEESLRLTFSNKLSLLRVGLPETRVQRLCPWTFPSSRINAPKR